MVKLDLPLPDTPVMQVKVPSGSDAVMPVRLLAVALWTVSFLPLPLRRLSGSGTERRPEEVVGGDAVGGGQHLIERPLRDDLAAVDAGAGAHVDDIVGGADRVLVMLDDQHGVAEISQAAQRLEQHVVVALMQPDAGFVEDVEHARQAAADLAGEADALGLAARERAAGAVEVEVIEADVVEETEALEDFLEDAFGDLLLLAVQCGGQVGEPLQRVDHGEVGGVADVLARQLDRARLGLEAGAVAGLAGLAALVLAELLAHPRTFGAEHAAG